MNNKDIAYILRKFPTFSQTFVQREVNSLIEAGYDVKIYSLYSKSYDESEENVENPKWKGKCEYYNYISKDIAKTTIKSFLKYRTNLILETYKLLKLKKRKNLKEIISLLKYIPKTLKIIEDIESQEINHIHAHWANKPTSLTYFIKNLTNINYSFTAHAYDIYSKGANTEKSLNQKIKQSTHVVTCTNYNKKYLENISPEEKQKIYLNYHGLKPKKYQNKREKTQKTYAVAGGRLVEKKGLKYLIKALAKIKKEENQEIPIKIFGDGNQREKLEKLKQENNLNKIEFKGKIPHEEVIKIFSEAQFFIAPSIIAKNGDRDGIPNVILEAYATKTPTIASKISGIPEIVKNNKTGWLTPPKNTEKLKNKILTAWNNPEKCHKYGEKGEKKVEKSFDSNKNIQEFVKILDQNLKK